MVAVFFGNNEVVHVVGGVALHLPNALTGQLEYDTVLLIVEEPFRAFDLDHTVTAERQLFGRLEVAVRISIESRGFGGGVSGIGSGISSRVSVPSASIL